MHGSAVSALAFRSGGRGFDPACGGCTVCPCIRKDDLWWMGSLSTDCALVMQHNGGYCMLMALALWWSIQGGQTSGGQTVGG